MRLIDADDLKEKFQECINSITVSDPFITGVKNGYESAGYWIDEAPTVEERKHGRWIHSCCSICNARLPSHIRLDYVLAKDFKYCYNCGAIMDGDNNGK